MLLKRHDNTVVRLRRIASIVMFAIVAGRVEATPIPVHLTTSIAPAVAHPGEIVTATVHVDIDPGWHVYSCSPPAAGGPSASEIVSLGNLAPAGSTTEDSPIRAHDPNFDLDVAYHENHATFTRQFQVPADAAKEIPSSHAAGVTQSIANLDFHYQTCNDKLCRPPADVTLPVSIPVEAGPVRSEYAKTTPTPVTAQASLPVNSASPSPEGTAGEGSNPAKGGGLLWFLLAAIGAGLLALVTPCVFPLIPITLSSFVKQADGDRRKLARLAIGYSAGIIVLYVLVGGVVTATLGASGAQKLAANPWVNLLLFGLFVVFALSFFETIQLQLPASLSGIQTSARKQSGVTGLMLMGIAFVLASFTCTAPFVGTLLVSAAAGDRLRPLLGMFVFALAFTTPFLLCAAFPSWIAKIPKGGVWLARVKATLGFVELIAALKFLSNADLVWQWRILTQPVMLGISAVILFCTFLYLIDLLRFGIVAETDFASPAPSSSGGSSPRKAIPAGRRVFAGIFLFATLYCFWGLAGRPISPIVGSFLPPAGYGGVAVAAVDSNLPWLADYQSALAEAKAQHKPLLIDFTGYTCTNCRLNEKNVFPRPEIQQQFADFVRVQLYTDGGVDGPKNQQLEQKMFDDVALPLYGIVDPSNEAVIDKVAGVVTPDRFSSFLANAKAKVASGLAASGSGPLTPNSGGTEPVASQAGAKPGPWSPLDASQIGRGTPTLVDFTASWCVNCHAIEKQVFDDPSVKPVLDSGFVTMRADMSNWDSPASQALEKRYDIQALPAVLVFDAKGNEIKSARITGLLSKEEFLKRIKAASL